MSVILKVRGNFFAVMFCTKVFFRELPQLAEMTYDLFKIKCQKQGLFT